MIVVAQSKQAASPYDADSDAQAPKINSES